MPDDFDELAGDLGSETEPSDQSTVEREEDQDLFGTDGDQSEDLDASPATDEADDADEGDSGSFLTDADRALIFRDPDQGIQNVADKANEFVRKQNRRFTSRMKEIAKTRKQLEQERQQMAALGGKFQEMKQKYPQLYREVEAFVSGKDVGEVAPNEKEPGTVKELLASVRDMIREEVGSVRGEYIKDKTTSAVDALISRARNSKLEERRDELIRIKQQNPDWDMRRVVGAVDPDLLIELTTKKNVSPGPTPLRPVQETVSRAPNIRTEDDAFDAAFNALRNRPA